MYSLVCLYDNDVLFSVRNKPKASCPFKFKIQYISVKKTVFGLLFNVKFSGNKTFLHFLYCTSCSEVPFVNQIWNL